MEVASASAAGATARKAPNDRGGKRRRHKDPKVTNLITIEPVAVPANASIVAKLTCPRNKGIPLSGGAIAPPAPASVAVSVLSRFNPNPPYKADRRRPITSASATPGSPRSSSAARSSARRG